MPTPKRVLFVSPVIARPAHSGNRARIAALVDAVTELGHEVHFARLTAEAEDDAPMAARFRTRYHNIAYRAPMRGRLLTRAVRRFGHLAPAWLAPSEGWYLDALDGWYDPAVDRALASLARITHFDAVVVTYVYLSKAFEAFGEQTLRVLDAQDVFSNRHAAYVSAGRRHSWFSTTPAEEARGLARADVVLAIEPREAAALSGLTAKRVLTVGHIVPPREIPTRADAEPPAVLFVGSGHPANEDALERLIRDIMPQVRARHPRAQLLVAGSICDALPAGAACVPLGRLPDLAAAYARADVVVNPVSLGTGLKIKCLEALSFGKPLVTTAEGARGLESGAGRAFLLADDAPAFAGSVVRLLTDRQAARALAQAGRSFLEELNGANRAAIAALFS